MNAQNDENIKYFTYVRKSSEDEEKQALSIDSQKEKAAETFAELNVVDVLEETKSAFTPYNRPVFDQMIDRIRKGEAQGIIAWHPDRLSRNEIEAAQMTYMLRTGQIKDLKFGSYNFDNSPEGIWMLQMALSQSQYFSAKLGKDVKRGMEKKVSMGWRPGMPPTGYLNDAGAEKGTKVIRKDSKRFPLVRKMWDLMLTGNYTVPQVWKAAESWGYTTLKRKKCGGVLITRSGLYEMFTNYFYTGDFEYNGKIYAGKHDAMITVEEFDRVQQLLGRKGKPKPKTHEFAFTGIIYCGECGCLYTAEEKPRYSKKTGKTKNHTYYHCTRKRKDVDCSQRKNVLLSDLELQIEEEIEKYTILPEFREWALDALSARNEVEIEDRSKIYESQHLAITKSQKELDELTKMRYRNLIDDEAFLMEKKALQLEIKKMQENLHSTEKRAEEWLDFGEKLFNFATYARKEFFLGDLQKKKEIFVALGQNFILKDGKLQLKANSWLVPISESYPELEKEYLKVRTGNYTSIKAKTEALTSVRTLWLPRSDSNRRPSD